MSEIRKTWLAFLLFFLPAAAFVSVAILPSGWLLIKREQASLLAREESRVRLASKFVSRDFESIISDLLLISSNPAMETWAEKGGEPRGYGIENQLLVFQRQKLHYANVRLLDVAGNELVRVENWGGRVDALQRKQLQKKGHRKYFKEAISLLPGDVYISPLELNSERGKIERPFKPVIRFGSVLADRKGRKKGVIFLNYLAKNLIDDLVGALENSGGHGMFIDRAGLWFHAPDSAEEWGRQMGTGHSFAAKYPEIWPEMAGKTRGISRTGGKVFTYFTVFPVQEASKHMTDYSLKRWVDANAHAYRWKVISVLDEAAVLAPYYRGLWTLFAVLMATAALVSFFLARWRLAKGRADRELRQSQRSLNQAQRIAHLGSWEWELASGNLVWSNEAFRIFGHGPGDFSPNIESFRKAVYPGDRKKVEEAMEIALSRNVPYEIECRIVTPAGNVRHIWQLGQVQRDSRGTPVAAFGMVLDITERKLAEEQVTKLNRELERRVEQRTEELAETNQHLTTAQSQLSAAIEAISDGLVLFDSEDRLTLRNTKILELLPGIADAIRPGAKYEEIARQALERGEVPEVSGKEEKFLKRLLERHRNPKGPIEWQTGNGDWILTEEHRAADGGYVSMSRDITLRKKAEEALRESEERVRLLLESTAEAIYGIDLDGLCTFVNPACLKLLGYDNQETCVGKNMHDLIRHCEADGKPCQASSCKILQVFTTRAPAHTDDETFQRADGSGFEVEYWCYPILKGEELVGGVVTFLDITDRKTAEAELRQAQKMEVIGQLTGGVAHDFNNILQIISAYSQVAQSKLKKGSEIAGYLEKVIQAAKRAATLTQQLLAFSRQQVRQPRQMQINDLIQNLVAMLGRIIGEDIELGLSYGEELDPIFADPGMIEQVIMNLCVNARDAMPNGGSLTITTESFTVDEGFVQAYGWAAVGEYLLITVSDTGSGMTPEVMEKIFDPFFTTKEIGKGTGLGLSTAYGTIRQHGGNFVVHSDEGVGSTFKIYLPTCTDLESEEIEIRIEEAVPGGGETILVAEDEGAVLGMVREMLEEKGYTVLTATNGVEALDVFAGRKNEIDLVLLDVVMPKMGGREVYDEIRKLNPAQPVMFTTGYAANAIDADFLAINGLKLVSKPYSPNDLFQTVRQAIDGK